MAKGILKVKAKVSGEKTKVKLMAKHIMESGLRKDKKTGELIPAKFLQELKIMHAGKEVFVANLGTAVSKNPYFAFNFAGGASGDELTMTWVENTGETATETAKVK
ncbi:thiosulfate oxidation carrier complex protein SoxZ [Neptuniibacter pectenicola]|jgi:sulfur-oxidizing protein SoxZ|uniref:Thiosulfate oxidation carrier complex protein SoxZ n=1 Tax=Neptuniibacter pectenicola TaxID=1806669 RepID=A0ABU9TQM1_9GAMM|nr:thiosulfate oxidation carrier complex protein SoxZ [Neptuniibacter pectenicola]KXJ50290.1 MAG: thiosulfate oxidation carrier complex protein SoxZ [Neptuniibacter sp. Phe_28]|tara:strand:- start:9445 stop:9762 length:318 start_codon:yes stop_codon:yes gene_type:complete